MTTRRWLPTLGAALLAISAARCGEETTTTSPEPEPTFEAGPLVERTVQICEGATLQAPDNLELHEDGDVVTIEGPGFPAGATVVCERQDTVYPALGRSGSGGSSTPSSTGVTTWSIVEVHTAGNRRWHCTGQSQNEQNADVLRALCQSLTPVMHPHLVDIACPEVEGRDAAAVRTAWTSAANALLACAEPTQNMTSSRLSFELPAARGNGLFTGFFRSAEEGCFEGVIETLRADPALAGEGEMRVRCEAVYRAY